MTFKSWPKKGTSIVAEQLDYAKNRRQKQIKPTGPGPSAPAAAPSTPEAPAPSGTDLSKQLAAWEQKYDLVSEASNPISRFLTRRLTRIRGFDDRARDNRIRMDMLRSAVKAYKALGKLQIQIVAGRKDSIDQANKMMQMVWHEWAILARSFATFKQLTTNQPPTDGGPSVELPPDDKEKQEPPLPNMEPTVQPTPKMRKIPVAKPSQEKLDVFPITPNPNAAKLPNDQIEKKPATELETVAQAFVKKWLGKRRQQLFPQPNSSYRLEVFKMATQLRKDINLVMNSLEKGLDYQQLEGLVSGVNKQMSTLRMLMRSLHLSDKPGESGFMPF